MSPEATNKASRWNNGTFDILIWGFIIFSFSGFLDATYLTVSHYAGTELNCTLTNGCGTVTTSEYATIGPIPVALLGMFFYFTMLISSLIYLDTKNEFTRKIISFLPITGLIASIYFVSLQLFVIKAICQYCMVSAATSTILFIFAMIMIVRERKNKELHHHS